jgi:hypothetical protein
MQPDEPIDHELLRNAVVAEVMVTKVEVNPTSTGDRYVRLQGRLGDDEKSHVEWAATRLHLRPRGARHRAVGN